MQPTYFAPASHNFLDSKQQQQHSPSPPSTSSTGPRVIPLSALPPSALVNAHALVAHQAQQAASFVEHPPSYASAMSPSQFHGSPMSPDSPGSMASQGTEFAFSTPAMSTPGTQWSGSPLLKSSQGLAHQVQVQQQQQQQQQSPPVGYAPAPQQQQQVYGQQQQYGSSQMQSQLLMSPRGTTTSPPSTSSGRVFIPPPSRPYQNRAESPYQHQPVERALTPVVAEEPFVAPRDEDYLRKGSELGLTLGDFDILDTLGTGTFGRVLLSRLRLSRRRPLQSKPHFFALKVLMKSTIVKLRQVEHLNSERTTLASVQHPFVVNLFCTFQDERNLYLVMEYVQGGELFSHLRRAGRFSADVARFYAANLILALSYLHSIDIIYRDLKPENLLLSPTGYLKIADFGFAKKVKDRTFTVCGTPEYLAPEIITASGHGKAADYWAFGVLLFELLAGYPPFFDDNPLGIYEKILGGQFSFPPHIDSCARHLISSLLTADLTHRLGNLRNGAGDIFAHAWFTGVDWADVEQQRVRAPIVPRRAEEGDTSNFERYPGIDLNELPGVLGGPPREDDPYGYLFPCF